MAKVADAGIAVSFNVLHCDGSPLVPPLGESEVAIINRETDREFYSEGSGRSGLAAPANLNLYSVLMLDLSGSIFEYGAENAVIEGARAYIRSLVAPRDSDSEQLARIKRSHRVALYIFSFGEPIQLTDFTGDQAALDAALDGAIAATRKGSTDLYGAYRFALERVKSRLHPTSDLVERFVVILTDGAQQAGGGEELRRQTLALKEESADVHIFSVGIEEASNEESVRELANEAFVGVEETSQLAQRFVDIAGTVEAIASSNYAVVVCTPVYLTRSEAILQISRDGTVSRTPIPYDPVMLGLTGDTNNCDPDVLLRAFASEKHCLLTCSATEDCNVSAGLVYAVLQTCESGVCRAYCQTDADCVRNPALQVQGEPFICAQEYEASKSCLAPCTPDCRRCTADGRGCVEFACSTAQDCEDIGLFGTACF